MTSLPTFHRRKAGGHYARLMGTLHRHLKVEQAGDAALGLLCRVWSYCADTGRPSLTDLEMARLMARDKNGPRKLKALLDARLLDRIEGGYTPHDWYEHNPGLARDGESNARDGESNARDGEENVTRNATGNVSGRHEEKRGFTQHLSRPRTQEVREKNKITDLPSTLFSADSSGRDGSGVEGRESRFPEPTEAQRPTAFAPPAPPAPSAPSAPGAPQAAPQAPGQAHPAGPVATRPSEGAVRARGGSPSPLGSVLGSVVGSLAEAAPAAVYTPPPEPTLPAPVALPLPVRRTSWHAERAALLFRREWAQRYAGSEPTMGGRSVAGLHERVASTAEARGEDPEVLFLAVLGRWLMRERTEVEARAPFACFAARWGELTMPEGSIVAPGQAESIEAQIKRAESELDALAKRGAPTAELKQIGDRIRALYRERDQRDEKWGPRAKR